MTESKKKRICLFSSIFSTSGGVEATVADLANFLCKNGYDVELFSLSGTSKSQFSLDNNIQIRSISLPNVHFVQFFAQVLALFYLLFSKYDVIISNSYVSNLIACCVRVLTAKKVFIREFSNGLFLLDECSKLRLWLMKTFYPYCDYSICLSPEVSEFYRNHFLIPEKKCIWMPIPLRSSFIAETGKKAKYHNYLLYVGRLEQEKGVLRLIRLFKQVHDVFPNESLVICGDGSLRGEMEKLAIEYDIAEYVMFEGVISDLAPYYKYADATLVTSYREGQCLIIFESMVCGTPVIAFNCSTSFKMVISKDNGVLVENGDEKSFVEETIILLSDRDKRKRCSDECKKSVDNFLPEKVYKNMLEILENV